MRTINFEIEDIIAAAVQLQRFAPDSDAVSLFGSDGELEEEDLCAVAAAVSSPDYAAFLRTLQTRG